MTRRDEIEAYWESTNTVSLLDSNLRMLEESTVLRYLHRNMDFADLGCGGGESTVRYAAAVKSCLALEQSGHLRVQGQGPFRRGEADQRRAGRRLSVRPEQIQEPLRRRADATRGHQLPELGGAEGRHRERALDAQAAAGST